MARPPLYLNARTGALNGITSMTLGNPAVPLETYIINNVVSNIDQIYDSDLVVATLLKNFDPGYVAGGSSGFDSDQIVAIINENVVTGGAGFDSDQIVAIINENVVASVGITDSDYSVVSILRNDLESDASHTSLRFLEIYNLLDSESQKVQALKTRVYGLVKNNDSDHNKKLNLLETNADSDHLKFASLRRFVLSITGVPTNDLPYYYSAAGPYGSNPFHDSDLILQTVNKGYNPSAATYDSDLVVTTIAKAGGSTLKDEFLDSDEVYNMGVEHGWFYDSDKVVDTLGKNFQYVINITNNNLGKVDSDFVFTMLDSEEVLNMFAEHELAYQSDLDSESAEIRLLRADVDSLVAGTYNDAPVIARLNDLEQSLDSESARINLALANADSDVVNIAILRRDADSDSIAIQAIKAQADLDSAYITLMRNDLDSDGSKLQALDTRMKAVEAVNTIQVSQINSLTSNLDSDEARLESIDERVDVLELINHLDSDHIIAIINENTVGLTDSDLAVVAKLRSDVDSDSIKIQDLQTQIDNLVDDTGFDSDQIESMINEHVTPYDDTNVVARLDSDSIRIQTLQGQVDVLEAGTYDDSAVVARLDSDEIIIQSLQAQIDSLISNVDSDSIVIQDLQTQINNIDVNDLRARLDSDSTVIQAIRTSVDSDYALFNEKIALFNGLTDSDLTTVSILRNDIDSESLQIRILRADVDSDSIRIQTLQGQVAALEAGTYDDSAVVARLDSDSAVIQSLQTQISSLDSEYVIERTPLRLNNAAFATTSSNQVLDIYDGNEHKTVKYIISAKKGTDWQSSECLINHDGSTAYITEYAIMDSGAGDLYIPDADVSGNDVRLLITPQVTNISVSIVRTQID